MAMTFTSNFLLVKLSTGSSNWGGSANGNMETIDIEIKAAQTPISNRVPETLILRDTGETLLVHRQL